MTRGRGTLVGFVLLAVGLGLLVAAAISAVQARDFVRGAASADGVVTALNAGGSHPQIGFTDAAGRSVSYAQGGLIFGYKTGDRVRVLYDTSDPARTASVDDWGAIWSVPALLGIVGAFCAVVGVLRLTSNGS